ncbi:DUF4377 domain-containing protein [Pseudohalocynthiibacter aestuariivivens]|nr:DUF4377 domain-containing protein [Pseudohalocynthiibacter aestuariivivens]QIE46770.1 DUF4377 domain-containing protein [Pseudohalocynthiibacter aestuariivivens]
MMKYILASVTMPFLAGCVPADTPPSVIQTVTVGPETVDCVGGAPQTCLIVDGSYFYDPIKGFTHRPGVTSVLEIERQTVCGAETGTTCPADASSYQYVLRRVVSQTPR